MQPLLIFHNHLFDTNKLIEGRLVLIDKALDIVVDEFRATSGLPGYQKPLDFSIKGRGTIPKASDVGIANYRVDVTPIYLPSVKGVEGNFYRILPYSVAIGKIERGDFGVHADKNVPGSTGCIVLTTDMGWDAFKTGMKELADGGVKTVPLLVSYSRI